MSFAKRALLCSFRFIPRFQLTSFSKKVDTKVKVKFFLFVSIGNVWIPNLISDVMQIDFWIFSPHDAIYGSADISLAQEL